MSRALHCRRENPGLFTAGQYVHLHAHGERASHVFAFERRHEGRLAVVVVPRLIARLSEWGDTRVTLPERMRNIFTGQTLERGDVPLKNLLADLPAALLVNR